MSTANPANRRLIVLDFDNTFIAANTDPVAAKAVKNTLVQGNIYAQFKQDKKWTNYMRAIFEQLYLENFTQEQYSQLMRTIPMVPGMLELLKCDNTDFIIISDSNSFFIDTLLEHFGVHSSIAKVFTNPAHFDEKGCLVLRPYHEPLQTWCSLCPGNLCKGRVLNSWLQSHLHGYTQVVMVGDGSGDLCPSLTLPRATDLAMCRRGFSLEKRLTEAVKNNQLVAQHFSWTTGFDIIDYLSR